MRPRSAVPGILAVVLMTLALVVLPPHAIAHETENVPGYDVEVGWGQEPAFTGQLNSVEVLAKTADGQPVVQFAGELKVKITHGQASVTLPMEPYKPGDLRAWVVPMDPGRYTFHLTGKIGDQTIDLTASSGPKSFDDVQEAATIPSGDTSVSAPDAGAEVQPVTSEQTAIATAADVSSTPNDGTSRGTVLAIAALALAAIALALGTYAVASTRRA
jgi:hypothetical protein